VFHPPELLVRCNLPLSWPAGCCIAIQPQTVRFYYVLGILTVNRGHPFLTGQHVLCLLNGSHLKTSVTPCHDAINLLLDLLNFMTSPFQVLDKLSAISSHSRGSPSISTLGTRTPNSTVGSYGRSATRQPSFTRPLEDEVIDNERVAYSYASDDRSVTPPASVRRITELSPRQRLVSEPTSPRKLRLAGSGVFPSPSRLSNLADLERSPPPPVSARRSPTLTRRPRQPLPREFTFSESPLDARVNHSILYCSPSDLSHSLQAPQAMFFPSWQALQ
jgi:hypothetical protein